MSENVLWTEAYRPTSLEETALTEGNRRLLQSYIDEGEIDHLLLVGPAGCGKTTVAKILTDQLDCKVLQLNASSERGIDTIRDKVTNFVRGRMGGKWNIVFLDEADALTRDAQTSLRNTMEEHSGRGRFIMTANYPHKILDPIKSRCQVIGMSQTPLKERYQILLNVLNSEGVPVPDEAVAASYAQRYKDLRRMLRAAQKSYLSHGELRPASDAVVSGEEIFEACKSKNWTYVREISQNAAFDHRAALTDLFWAIEDDFPRAASWRAEVAEAVHESQFTPDPVVHFLGTCASLMSTM